ncbi:MAG: amidohydrolase [Bacillota bacterium]|nr:amidohydrolase [Bacillota bacterium]
MTRDELKNRVIASIDSRKDELIATGNDIFAHPELGYKEFRTSQIVQDVFGKLGLSFESGLAVTGVKAKLAGRQSLANVCVMGELDSVLCPGHPQADPQTGAAHSCGHNAQIAMLLGVAYGLVESGVMSELDGDVSLVAVPAEEYVEIEYRNKIRNEGKIKFLGGKQEMITAGALDDVDMAMMIHLGITRDGKKVTLGGSNNGFIGKFIKYTGKEAHAGGAPHDGINALNAAMLGIFGIHAQRETFKDSDTIRVHPIITKGGNLVNVIPCDVRAETYVRGKTMDAVMDASKKVDRALKAGAMAVGAEVEIQTLPGYLPRTSDVAMDELFRGNVSRFLTSDEIKVSNEHSTGSTDMGDISAIMPAIHPHIGGAEGIGHSENYQITDPELAYITGAKAMALTVIDLLHDGAARTLEIKRSFKPLYTKESYLKMWEDLLRG